MDYKETYEKSWELSKKSNFFDTERNSLLPEFFPLSNDRVLDLAGGAGIVSQWLMGRGYDVSLVEFSDVAMEEAKIRGIKSITKLFFDSGAILPFENESFDCVFFGDIIEHLFDPESILREVKRVLKPTGRLVISCPNMAYWRFRMYFAVDGDLERVDVIKARAWEQEHIRFFNIRILKDLLGSLGFDFVKFRGVNKIWHSKWFVARWPNLFAHTIVSEFRKK